MAKAKICAVEGCGKQSYVRGWCTKHYQRWQLHGDPLYEKAALPVQCTAEGCEKKHFSRGLCSLHYRKASFRADCTVVGCKKKAHSHGLCVMHGKRAARNGSVDSVQRLHNGAYREWFEENKTYDGDECLIWPHPINVFDGRPSVLSIDGRRVTSAGYMCELVHGERPTPEHMAAHSCGNGDGGCLAPKHLRWATHAENMQDMVDHGRSNRGIKHPSAKLADSDVIDIRRMLERGDTLRGIAAIYSVTHRTISDIKAKRTWRWL